MLGAVVDGAVDEPGSSAGGSVEVGAGDGRKDGAPVVADVGAFDVGKAAPLLLLLREGAGVGAEVTGERELDGSGGRVCEQSSIQAVPG